MLVEFSFGLIFWMSVSFLVVLYILGKFAWKPILGVLSERERTIESALNEAQKARDEIASMNARNEELMREAREERELLLKEARDIRDREVAEAKAKAKAEGDALLARAREDIRNERNAAITALKNHVAELSIQVAERILKEKLATTDAQGRLVEQVINDADLHRS